MLREPRQDTIDFLRRHANLIQQGDFEALYRIAVPTAVTHEITTVLYESGIDPLKNLSYIPKGFLSMSDREQFIVPNHIKTIESFAFSYSELKEIFIPVSVELFQHSIFYVCPLLQYIYYEGTEEQWKKIWGVEQAEIPETAAVLFNCRKEDLYETN